MVKLCIVCVEEETWWEKKLVYEGGGKVGEVEKLKSLGYRSDLDNDLVKNAAVATLQHFNSSTFQLLFSGKVATVHFLPIDHIEERLDIIRATVLIVQIVGMFPNI